jgi:hypothetical protein
VEAPGDFIGIFVEFAPRVKPGHNQFQGAYLLGGVDIHRDSPAVVFHPDHIVSFQDHQDSVTIALHGLIDRIVHHFKYQMMETVNAGGPDIHSGTLPDRLQSLEHLNILS